jgi:hypothetical protein
MATEKRDVDNLRTANAPIVGRTSAANAVSPPAAPAKPHPKGRDNEPITREKAKHTVRWRK